jgi:hypothetical protein
VLPRSRAGEAPREAAGVAPVRRRDADGPAFERELTSPLSRSEPLPLAGAGKRTRELRSNTGELTLPPEERVSSTVRDGTALRVGEGLADEDEVRSGAGAL